MTHINKYPGTAADWPYVHVATTRARTRTYRSTPIQRTYCVCLLVQEQQYEDVKVQAMKEYEYRVTALNDGGESDPSDGSKPIKAKKLKEAPKVTLT